MKKIKRLLEEKVNDYGTMLCALEKGRDYKDAKYSTYTDAEVLEIITSREFKRGFISALLMLVDEKDELANKYKELDAVGDIFLDYEKMIEEIRDRSELGSILELLESEDNTNE